MSYYRLQNPNELAGGPRLGGCIVGPENGTGCIWKGRPPVMGEGYGPRVLSLAATGVGALGTNIRSVRIHAEMGNAWGGVITRTFDIGEGISASMNAGAFAHVHITTTTPVPAGFTVFFSWTDELPAATGNLFLYQFSTLTAGVRTAIPEGCTGIIPESACTLGFDVRRFGATFNLAANAGQEVPAVWGTVSSNVTTEVMFKLRSV